MSPALLDSALDAARNGFDVFPVRPREKKPLVKGWQRSATHDLEIVERVWHEHPEANIGIRCGNGLIVIDADSEIGETALREYELPNTTTVKSARGKQFYFRGDGSTRAAILPDVDVRGRGGLVVGAGSVHPSGARYAYVISPAEAPPARLPKALETLISRENQSSLRRYSPPSSTSICTSVTTVITPIRRGRRNQTLFDYARAMHAAAIAPDAILVALRAVNAERCDPPISPDDVETIVASAVRYAATPWKADPHGFARDPRLDSRERHVLRALAHYANLTGECFPGVRKLREDTGMGHKAILTAIDGLEEAGRIVVERGNRGRSNRYRLIAQ
jgi:hypothetical protein